MSDDCAGIAEVSGPNGKVKIHFRVPSHQADEILSHVVVWPGDKVAPDASSGPCTRKYGNSLPNLAACFSSRIDGAAVWVVAPTMYHRDVFADFSTFISGETELGRPVDPSYGANRNCKYAVPQLEAVLSAAFSHVWRDKETEASFERLKSLPISLFGFSKGGVVLNQLLAEAPAEIEKGSVWDRLKEVSYLDAGLSQPGAYLTDQGALRRAAMLRPSVSCGGKLAIRYHGTPFQWFNPARGPVIVNEATLAFRCLRASEADTQMMTYFEGEAPSMEIHFAIMESFMCGSRAE